MKFDLNQLNDLELENIGSWPKEVKVVFAILLFVAVLGAGYYFVVKDSIKAWNKLQDKEIELKSQFEAKYRLAANLPRYREQLKQMNEQFRDMLAMLPTEAEMPALLDDVTFLATDANLKISSLSWLPERPQEFYTELPIEMKISGGYHEFGNFSAGVADLPRIVSLHDFTMLTSESGVAVTVLAKTYQFSENQVKEGENK